MDRGEELSANVTKKRLRQPRVAEIVASSLRARILSGALPDGAMLPKQEDLLNEFGVSPPCIREAFRILETEGLVTVIRGNVGGAIVHVPHAGTAAYMLGLVLQSRGVSLYDLLNGMRLLEPACAGEAAQRPDRATTVLPKLRANINACAQAVDDPAAFISLARAFHVELVSNCGNETMSLVVGALERLWTVQMEALAVDRSNHGSFSDRAVRQSLLSEHERIYRAIEDGDASAAERAIREHFSGGAERRHGFDTSVVIKADMLQF